MSWTRPRLRSRTTLATQGLFGRALTQPSRTYMVLAQVLSNDEANMKPAVLGCLDAQDHYPEPVLRWNDLAVAIPVSLIVFFDWVPTPLEPQYSRRARAAWLGPSLQ